MTATVKLMMKTPTLRMISKLMMKLTLMMVSKLMITNFLKMMTYTNQERRQRQFYNMLLDRFQIRLACPQASMPWSAR